MDEEFGEDFDDKGAAEPGKGGEPSEITRVRLPHGTEVLGVVDQLLGLRKMYVRCFDGKTRLARVPGRFRRSMWVRQNDVVIVEPWEYDNMKGDIVFTYRKGQVDWLRDRGYLKDLESF